MRVRDADLLQLQLTEADKRHFKSLTGSRGMPLQETVYQDLGGWIEQTGKKNHKRGVEL